MFSRKVVILATLMLIMITLYACNHAPSVSIAPKNSSDSNWVNGVAKSWDAAFFVDNSPEVQKAVSVGNKVTFADGTIRTIVNTKENSGCLIIFLDGLPLDGAVVGYPNKVTVRLYFL